MQRPWILIAATDAGLMVSQHYSRDEAAQAIAELNAAGRAVTTSAIYTVQYGELVLSEEPTQPAQA